IKERQLLLTNNSVLLMDSSGRLVLNSSGVPHRSFGESGLFGDRGWEVIRCGPDQYDRFKKLFPEAIVVTSPAIVSDAPERWPQARSDNFLDAIKKPAVQRTNAGMAVAEQLAESRVPTVNEAVKLAEKAWEDSYRG